MSRIGPVPGGRYRAVRAAVRRSANGQTPPALETEVTQLTTQLSDARALKAGQVANAQVRLTEVVAKSFPWCTEDLDAMRAVFAGYTARKRAQQLCDFDDLLLLARALGASEGGARLLAGLFDHVLVDEYQDVNNLQADLVSLLRPGGAGLTVVGDDAQAIYGFRAATTAAIAEFPSRYPGAVVVRLEHNYRSTQGILAVANQVMAEGPQGATKTLWSERPGARRPLLRTCADESSQAEADPGQP